MNDTEPFASKPSLQQPYCTFHPLFLKQPFNLWSLCERREHGEELAVLGALLGLHVIIQSVIGHNHVNVLSTISVIAPIHYDFVHLLGQERRHVTVYVIEDAYSARSCRIVNSSDHIKRQVFNYWLIKLDMPQW